MPRVLLCWRDAAASLGCCCEYYIRVIQRALARLGQATFPEGGVARGVFAALAGGIS